MSESCSLGSFAGYRQMIMDLTGDLRKLNEFAQELGLARTSDAIIDVIERIANDSFDIAIIGEFKRGKSTLINALLGRDVLPTTATLNRVTYSVTPFVRIEYKDGKTEEIEIEKLPDYVTKLTDESERISETIKQATVYYPVNYCKNNVDIIDTPGLNDDRNMTEVTLSVLPSIDAALMVIMAQSPFSEYERDFLENKLLTSDLGRVMFAVTGIDRLDEDEVDKVLTSIATRIERYVIAKAARTLGEDSKEFEVYKRKLGKPRVFGISAKQALKAKLKGDDELLARSRFPALEAELERFLTEDRGAVTLQVPLSRIVSSGAEIISSAHLRENALSMERDEFENKYKEASAEIERIRLNKQQEFMRINSSAKEAYQSLRPLIDSFWPEVEAEAMDIIENYPLTPDDLKKERIEAAQEELLKRIRAAAANKGQLMSEQIQHQIDLAMGTEVERLQEFEDYFYNSIGNIQSMFSPTGSVVGSSTGTDLAIGSAIGSLIGGGLVGGAFVGYKESGLKGALLGGGVGLATTIGVGLLAGALGITVGLPVIIVAAVAGTFGAKFAISKLIVGDRVNKYKEQVKESVKKQFADMRSQDQFSDNVRAQVEQSFNALRDRLEKETETILGDTQKTLDELKYKLSQNEILSESEHANLKKMTGLTTSIIANAESINSKLVEVLAR